MDKPTGVKEKVNTTCPCGAEGEKAITAELKDGSQQNYCSPQCKQEDKPRQKQQAP